METNSEGEEEPDENFRAMLRNVLQAGNALVGMGEEALGFTWVNSEAPVLREIQFCMKNAELHCLKWVHSIREVMSYYFLLALHKVVC